MKKVLAVIMFLAFCGSLNAAGIKNAADLADYAGKTVTVKGVVSNVMWQHIMQWPEGYKHETYLDIGNGQTVVYSKEKIECKGKIKVTGRVIEVDYMGVTKRGKKTKIDEPHYKEYHIAADKWKCS